MLTHTIDIGRQLDNAMKITGFVAPVDDRHQAGNDITIVDKAKGTEWQYEIVSVQPVDPIQITSAEAYFLAGMNAYRFAQLLRERYHGKELNLIVIKLKSE